MDTNKIRAKSMPLSITRRQIAAAMCCLPATVSSRLKGLPVSLSPTTGRGGRHHVYNLAAVLPHVKNPEHIGPLFRGSTDDSSLYVGTGAEVVEMAARLDEWLTPAMRARYAKVRAQMLAGLTTSRGGAAYLPFLEGLNQKALLHSEVLRHVALGVPCLIDFSRFAPAFCLVNTAYEPETIFIDSTRPELGAWRLAA